MAATLALIEDNPKSTHSEGRARVGLPPGPLGRHPGSKAKISKVLRTLLDALDENDLTQVVRVYRDAMNATRTFYLGPQGDEKGQWVTEADHKTRITAANMVAAYMEGLPIQRQIQMRGDFVELGDMLRNMQASGEARRLMPAIKSLPTVAERKE